ncbi:hypothetical protein COCOBI_13-1020 [Coccomyxa sp. Obi]|nr:hypothetical protein COCOBI_13-1020 [Coccomyxa sp. Obi]
MFLSNSLALFERKTYLHSSKNLAWIEGIMQQKVAVPQANHQPRFHALPSGTFSLHRLGRRLSLLRFRPGPVRLPLTASTANPPIGNRHRPQP